MTYSYPRRQSRKRLVSLNESQFRKLIRHIIREEAKAVPGDAPPDEQVHVFDFDDTLGLTLNANGVMLYNNGEAVHKNEEEVRNWMKKVGLSSKDLLDPGIVEIPSRKGYAAYVNSAALAKLQNVYPKEQQKVTGVSEPSAEGEFLLIDFTPSSNTDTETTKPIKSTIDKLKQANAQGSDTIVITARKASGQGTDFHGNKIGATNEKDMMDFLSAQGAATTKGVMGVSGQNKGNAIIDKFVKSDDPPEEIHFYDDLTKNTDEVEQAVAEKVPAELFIYGPGEFAHGEADPNKPNKSFPKKVQKEGFEISRWARLAGLIKG